MAIKHALVVDDSKSARFSLKKLLQQQGIKTDFAESAGDALNYLSSNNPDIIFMDHLCRAWTDSKPPRPSNPIRTPATSRSSCAPPKKAPTTANRPLPLAHTPFCPNPLHQPP